MEHAVEAPTPKLAPRARRLMGPGPSEVHPRVHAAMTLPMIGHLDPQFLEIMEQEQKMLRQVFRTENRLTLPVSATGSGGMEASLVNMIEPGEEVIVGVAGYFAARMAEIAARCRAVVHRLEKTWGDSFETAEIEEVFARHPNARILALVHGETSTGALQPLREIGALCREQNRLLLVDAVATAGTSTSAIPAARNASARHLAWRPSPSARAPRPSSKGAEARWRAGTSTSAVSKPTGRRAAARTITRRRCR
jgi:alanine-glyoxylate transaminase/serine-glyoxylate transaminase/serine-pyruvate transaminase